MRTARPLMLAGAFLLVLTGRPAAGSGAPEPDQVSGMPLPYKYVGNSFSGKFHRPGCPFARAMSPTHVLLFHFRAQAVSAGQTPCRYCLPPVWRSTRVKLLPGPGLTGPGPATPPAPETPSAPRT